MPYKNLAERRRCDREAKKRAYARWKANPELLREIRASRSQKRITRHKGIIAAFKATGCVDCGEKGLSLLDCDHVDPRTKTSAVGRLANASRKRLLAELALCVVRCKKCHRKRTYRQVRQGVLQQNMKVSDDSVMLMRVWHQDGASVKALHRLFGVSQSLVSQICADRHREFRQ